MNVPYNVAFSWEEMSALSTRSPPVKTTAKFFSDNLLHPLLLKKSCLTTCCASVIRLSNRGCRWVHPLVKCIKYFIIF